jgi:hypothetical protein|tara:strand:- start:783 stop:1730 length:948 start_codon:yes stop_codon:yes gene_type:complete
MFPEDKLIAIYRISKPDIKEISIKQYIQNLKNYHKKVTNKDTFDWVDWDWLKFNPDILSDVKTLASKRNFYNSILPLFKSFGMQKVEGTQNLNVLEEQNKYGLAIQKINKEVRAMSSANIISDNKLEKYQVKFEEIQKLVLKLKLNKDFQSSLILFLMTEYKFRNEISNFKWISLQDFNKIDNLEGNYIVIGSRRMFISRGQFKTDKTHGRTETEIENKILRADIKKYIKKLDDNIMFKNSNGEMYSNDSLSQKIARLTKAEFGISLGTSSINSLYLETLNKDTLDALLTLSKNRGTSINILVSHYYNNIQHLNL